MKIIIPTNDRETIAVHTGRCKEFAVYTIENKKIVSEKFEPNLRTHEQSDCNHKKSEHNCLCNHDEFLQLFSQTDVLYYYALGKHMKNELDQNGISYQKVKSVYLKEIVEEVV